MTTQGYAFSPGQNQGAAAIAAARGNVAPLNFLSSNDLIPDDGIEAWRGGRDSLSQGLGGMISVLGRGFSEGINKRTDRAREDELRLENQKIREEEIAAEREFEREMHDLKEESAKPLRDLNIAEQELRNKILTSQLSALEKEEQLPEYSSGSFVSIPVKNEATGEDTGETIIIDKATGRILAGSQVTEPPSSTARGGLSHLGQQPLINPEVASQLGVPNTLLAADPALKKEELKTMAQIRSNSLQAAGAMASLEQLQSLLRDIETGVIVGSKPAILLRRLFGDDKLESAISIIDRMTPAMRQGLPGAASDRDVAMFKSSLPSIGRSREANMRILQGLIAMKKRDQEMVNFINKARRAGASLDDAMAHWEKFVSANSIFNTNPDGTINQANPLNKTTIEQFYGSSGGGLSSLGETPELNSARQEAQAAYDAALATPAGSPERAQALEEYKLKLQQFKKAGGDPREFIR